MPKIAIYARVSTAEQAEHGYSIEEQTDRTKKYCESLGWEVYHVYTDAGFSGAKVDRPALQELILDVEAGRVDKVLVYKLDRLSRSQKDTLMLIEDTFLKNGVDFVSMSENFDTSTPFGRAMIGILAVFAQLEREQIRERMMMGKDARAKKGLWAGSGYAPTGYTYENGELTPEPYEAMLVRTMFEMAAEGNTIYKIAKYMNDHGLYKNKPWHRASIRTILLSENYIGHIKRKGQWIPGCHEPIVDEETFQRARQAILDHASSAKNGNPRPGQASSILAGLLYCSKCGTKIYRLAYDKYQYYRCQARADSGYGKTCDAPIWKQQELEDIVIGEVLKLRFEPFTLSDGSEASAPAPDPSEGISAELSRIDHQIGRFMDLYADDEISADLLKEKISGLNDKKIKLTEELRAVEIEKRTKLTPQKIRQIAGDFSDMVETGSISEIRSVLMTLIERIETDGKDVKIFWKF